MDVRSHGVWLDVWNFIWSDSVRCTGDSTSSRVGSIPTQSFLKWVGGVQGWRTGLKIRGRPFDSDPTHQHLSDRRCHKPSQLVRLYSNHRRG